jgi:hypothetical protein
MTWLAAGILLSLGSAAIDLIGKNIQAKQAKKQAREDVAEANTDLVEAKNLATGSLVAQTAGMGVGGDSVSKTLGRTSSQYNEAIDKNNEDLDTFIKQTNLNLAFDTVSTVIGTGANVFNMAYSGGAFDKKPDDFWKTGSTKQLPQYGYSQGYGYDPNVHPTGLSYRGRGQAVVWKPHF